MNHKILRTTQKGQLVLPMEFRTRLGITAETDLSVSLSMDGAIQIRPVQILPISNLLKNNPALRGKVVGAIERAEKGEVLSEAQSQEFMSDDKNF
jgi:bifunctional DNA-binding transcriptional regulator/antitoxin component of YhaV-PrlF toxin-antitoxin module